MNTRIFLSVIALCLLLAGCKEEKPKVMSLKMVEQPEAKDLTIYGICSEGSSMNVVELVTPRGDTLAYMKDQEALEDPVKGGLSVGDNLALMPEATQDGEMTVKCVVNLTTLLGKWISLDKNFEIKDDGVVATTASPENNPWTSWKVFNGQLILGRDTFSVCELGADSLLLENEKGIFAFERQH